jgi:WD40 repeat protein/predicted Ser/Thr protein kinase
MPDPWQAALAALRRDQHQAWARGAPVPVEAYLAEQPGLGEDREHLLDLVQSEVLLRFEFDERPSPDEYIKRFPQHAEALRRMWCLLEPGGVSIDGLPAHDVPIADVPLDELATIYPPGAEPPDGRGDPGTPPWSPSPALSNSLKGFEVLELLGRGAAGVVYRARQTGLGRSVALKVMSAAWGADAGRRHRFRAEARAAARLHHPQIVQIFEVGEQNDLIYLVLEYVAGGSLADRLARSLLPPRQAAELVEGLARALHYAHRQGIIHRDLKPANVLLADDGLAKIADFGLAKNLTEDGDQTQTGALMGTASYMAPEQAGDSKAVSPAVDVYALGAILYECLTGRPPFCGETVLATLDQLRHQEPASVSRLQGGVPRDLETICMCCLQKEPHKRYGSAQELADDLRRFLRGEPIRARRVGIIERTLKWSRRRPTAAALVAVSLLSAASLAAGGLVYHFRLTGLLADEQTARQRAESSEKALAWQFESVRRDAYALQLAQAAQVAESDPGQALCLLADDRLCPADLQDFAWSLIRRRCLRGREIVPAQGDKARCSAARGDLTACGESDGRIVLCDLRSGERHALSPQHQGAVNCLAFHPSESTLASTGDDGTIRFWDTRACAPTRQFAGATEPLNALAFSADGRHLAAAGTDGLVRIWNLSTGRLERTFAGHRGSVFALAFSPDDRTLASGGKEGRVHLWNLDDGTSATLDGQLGWITCLAFGRRHLACGGSDRQVVVWDLADHRSVTRLAGQAGLVSGVGFLADDSGVVSCGFDAAVRVWDLATRRQRLVLTGHEAEIGSLSLLDGGAAALTVGLDQSARWWELGEKSETPIAQAHERFITAVAVGADSRALFSAGGDGAIRAWALENAAQMGSFCGGGGDDGGWITALACQPGGGLLASGNSAGMVRLHDGRSGEVRRSMDEQVLGCSSLIFSPDGRRLAAIGPFDQRVLLWDLQMVNSAAQSEAAFLDDGGAEKTCLAFSPRGPWLAAGSSEGRVAIWDVPTQRLLAQFQAHASQVCGIAFSPTTEIMVTAGRDGVLTAWDSSTLRRLHVYRGHNGAVNSLAFSPDGRTLATAAADGTIKLWDAVGGQSRLTLVGHDGAVLEVRFSPDGRTLVSTGADRSIHLWRAEATQAITGP